MSAAKMYVVPEDIMEVMRKRQRDRETERPQEKQRMDLDTELNKVLHHDEMNDYDKALIFNQMLNRYLQQKRVPAPDSPSNIIATTGSDISASQTKLDSIQDQTIMSVPKPYRTKATAFLRYLKDNDVHWETDGRVTIKGQTVSGSNILDIVNSAMRSRKTGKLPMGTDHLIRHLSTTNAPREIIGNPTWLRQTAREPASKRQLSPVAGFTDPPTPPASPVQPKRKSSRRKKDNNLGRSVRKWTAL